MNDLITPATARTSQSDSVRIRFDYLSGHLWSAHPAILASVFGCDSARAALIRTRALETEAELVAALQREESTLTIMPASCAVRAVVSGLQARIVSAAVAPPGPHHVAEPSIPWERVATRVRNVQPRAVIVASCKTIERAADSVRQGIGCYWRSAEVSFEAPSLLAIALSTEMPVGFDTAYAETRRALETWRPDPAVRLAGLQAVLDALVASHELPSHIDVATLIDERFVKADRQQVPTSFGWS